MTMPDPQTVREIATEHIRSGRADVGITVELMLIDTILTKHEHGTWCSAVREAIRSGVVTGTADTAANRLTALCEHFETYGEWPHNRSDSSDIANLRAVLDEREQLTARVTEQEAKRKADARAVVRAIQEICAATNCYPRAVEDAIGALNKHFASNIVAAGQQNDTADGSAR